MYLTGSDIIRRSIIDNPAPGAVQPASVDLRIGPETLKLKPQTIYAGAGNGPVVPEYDRRSWEDNKAIRLQPDDFLLAATIERVSIPTGLVARTEGKSSLGRIGLIVHATAGWIDPGFEGNITLELKNLGPASIYIPVGAFICQLSVASLEGTRFPVAYRGKYQQSVGVVGARWG